MGIYKKIKVFIIFLILLVFSVSHIVYADAYETNEEMGYGISLTDEVRKEVLENIR